MAIDLKQQRDRFLAFAFASADILLEVDIAAFKIIFATGATKGLNPSEDDQLKGMDFLDLFATRDHGLIKALKNRYKPGQRFGPVLVNLKENIEELGKGQMRTALLSGLSLPEAPEQIYFTLSRGHLNLVQGAETARRNMQEDLLDANQFAGAATKLMEAGTATGAKLDMTFIDLPGSAEFRQKIGQDKWAQLNENISGILRAYAADGKTAAKMDDGRYGVVHDAMVSAEQILRELETAAAESDPDNVGLQAEGQTIELNDEGLTEHEMAKAVVYTINKFVSKKGDFDIASLKGGFEDFLGQNAQQISHYKSIIYKQRFDLKYQPIVDLKTGDVAYYEVLTRFEPGVSPQSAIEFIEDVGLSPEFDLSICGRVLNYLIHQNKNEDLVLSVNLSGVSVQDKRFISKLRYKLEPHLKNNIAKHIIFEITESSEIRDLEKVNEFIKALQDDGFKVAMDDFGAGSASFQYLQKLHVDAVKIDGQYVATILDSKRDETMIRNLVRMCKDLDIKVVAEKVESKEIAYILKNMGVDFGQGYYFAKPMDTPSDIPRKAI